MVNAVFGKTIENLSDRDVVKICRISQELLHEVSKSTYKRQIIVNEEMVIVSQRKTLVYYNKPYYVGFSILDISKIFMYDYFYNILRKFYSGAERLQVLYSDTESFILKIRSSDIVSDLSRLQPSFDFSNLPTEHELYDDSKRSKLFNFKEEFALCPILRVISLGSKAYCVQLACCHNFKSHKNDSCRKNVPPLTTNNYVDKLVLKRISKRAQSELTFQDYFHVLNSQITRRIQDFRIQSKRQKVCSTMVHTIALSCFYDKRFVLDCGIHTTPYGMSTVSKCYANECL